MDDANMDDTDHETLIVRGARRFLNCANRFSYFYFLRHFTDNWKRPSDVDRYVVAWTSASILCFALSFILQLWPLNLFIALVAILRVYEYSFYQCYVVFFGMAPDHYVKTPPYDYRRLVILVVCNYVETIFWFATWYSFLAQAGMLKIEKIRSSLCIFRESIVAMVGNSTSCMEYTSSLAYIVATMNNAIGLLLSIVLLARFISVLPRSPAITEGK